MSHRYLSLPLLRMKCFCKVEKVLVVIKFWQKLSKQDVKHYGLRARDSLILFRVRKNCLISERSPLLYQFTKRVIQSTGVIIKEYHSYWLHTRFYPIFFIKSSHVDKIIGDHQCGLCHNRPTTDQIFTFIRCWRKYGSTMKRAQLFICFKESLRFS
jgi:hypothetical protein